MLRITTLALFTALCFGCAPTQEAQQEPQKPAQAEVSSEPWSLKDEIAMGDKLEAMAIKDFQDHGFPVDQDVAVLGRLTAMLKQITAVSHRPNLPWKIHYVPMPSIDTLALPGGKIFVTKGLLDGLVKEEDHEALATVISHEVAHIVCRHDADPSRWAALARTVRAIPHYTNDHEAEADRLGLLYMALAGFEPERVGQFWIEAYLKYRDPVVPYVFHHTFNADHYHRTLRLTLAAKQYFHARMKAHPDTVAILKHNAMTHEMVGEEDPLPARLPVLVTAYEKDFDRGSGVQPVAATPTSSELAKLVEVSNKRIQKQKDDRDAIFADLTNKSTTTALKSVLVRLHYLDAAGKILSVDQKKLEKLDAGEKKSAGFFLQAVPGAVNYEIVVGHVE